MAGNTAVHNFSYLQAIKAQACSCVFTPALYANVSCVYPAYVMAIWFALPILRHSKLQLCGFGTLEVGLYRSFAAEYSSIHSFHRNLFPLHCSLYKYRVGCLLHYPIWGQHECHAITWHVSVLPSCHVQCHLHIAVHLQSRSVMLS
jgi:hypothetical protein